MADPAASVKVAARHTHHQHINDIVVFITNYRARFIWTANVQCLGYGKHLWRGIGLKLEHQVCSEHFRKLPCLPDCLSVSQRSGRPS